MRKVEDILFALLYSEISNKSAESIKNQITPEIMGELLELSKRHDLSHIVANSLAKLGLLGDDETSKKFQTNRFSAVLRYAKTHQELESISTVLEKNKVAFIPLKGAVISKLYPEPWMRTSCDIDILVKEEDLDRAIDALKSGLGYEGSGERNYHDVDLRSKNGVHLELHYNILEKMENIDKLLAKVWDYVQLDRGEYCYAQIKEYLVFHVVAHTSYHFVNGGCGIKPFIDLYLLRKSGYNETSVREFCESCGILEFYDKLFELVDVWFGENPHTDVTTQMEEYVLTGGVYGTIENKLAVKQTEKGGKAKYLRSRIFVPSSVIKEYYPIAEKHPWLVPFMQVRRWFRIIFCGGAKRSMQEISISQNVTKEQTNKIDYLLTNLGLKPKNK